MKCGAENPLSDFLIVNHNSGLWEKCHETIRDAQLCGSLSAIICTAGTPKIQLGPICL
jgi:hypothetical protein